MGWPEKTAPDIPAAASTAQLIDLARQHFVGHKRAMPDIADQYITPHYIVLPFSKIDQLLHYLGFKV